MKTIMSLMSGNVGIEEPPWVWGPTEGAKWAGASNASGRKRKAKRYKASIRKETIPNPQIRIDLNTRKEVAGHGFREKVLEDFDMGRAAEVVVRSLHKAKITTLSRLWADGVENHVLLKDPDNISEVLEALENSRQEVKSSRFFYINLNGRRSGSCRGKVAIRKVHGRNDSPIELIFKGDVAKVRMSQVINHIKKHLDVKTVETNW